MWMMWLAQLLATISDEEFKKEKTWTNWDGHVWVIVRGNRQGQLSIWKI